VTRLAAADAQTYWMSAKIPNDQFLVYAFAGSPGDIDTVLRDLKIRAAGIPELTVRIGDRGALRYPIWHQHGITDNQFVRHRGGGYDWSAIPAHVGALGTAQLDVTDAAWRLHIFEPVLGLPGMEGPGVVVVLQISHALGDGIRSAALAARLLGRSAVIPGPQRRTSPGALPWRMVSAARAHRQLVADTEAGVIAPQAPSLPVLRTNTRPQGTPVLRTIVVSRAALTGPTVTVSVLAAVADALAGQLRELGEDTAHLGAEVPLARSGARWANNHFGNVGIGLHPGISRFERMVRLVDELRQRRRRAEHPAMRAAAAATAALPAPLLRWGVAQFDPDVRSATVTGHTVVSSVHRGAADLRLGSARVLFTAGYPALSPMMGLTHGVHGIGDTVAVSVHTTTVAVGDVDGYLDRLATELARG